jgi:polysaccharide deacetylase family protein (PEP-CTERM system associated)
MLPLCPRVSMVNALTFDIEEYFHAEAFAKVVTPARWSTLTSRVVLTTERLLDQLEEMSTAATFFVLGWVAERHPGLMRRIRDRGHELACHGYGHQMITRQSRSEFARDVTRAKAAIEDASGESVIGYRAPTFSVVRDTLWSLEALAEAGFRYDSSIFPIVHDRYGIPGAARFPHRHRFGSGSELAEFPLSTVSLLGWRFPVAGGGYLRLLPYGVTRRAIRYLNRYERQPAMVYVHPWELDVEQPRLPVGILTQLRHSMNTSATEAKLRRLMREFRFAPARDVLEGAGVLVTGGTR